MTTRAFGTEWGNVIASATSAATGPSITPGNNTYGTAVQLLSGAQVVDDAFGIYLNVNSVAVSGSARDCLAKVQIDGVDVIPDLLVSCAGAIAGAGGGGVAYYFPLRIKAGSAVGVALSVNNATVGTGAAFCRLFCRPATLTPPRTGSFVRAFGITSASSSGTAITPNSAGGKSAYVQLGSAVAAGDLLWWWCGGVGCNNTVINGNPHSFDVAIGSSTTVNRNVITDQLVLTGTLETLQTTSRGEVALANPGDLIFARAGGPGASSTGMSYAAYGMGG